MIRATIIMSPVKRERDAWLSGQSARGNRCRRSRLCRSRCLWHEDAIKVSGSPRRAHVPGSSAVAQIEWSLSHHHDEIGIASLIRSSDRATLRCVRNAPITAREVVGSQIYKIAAILIVIH